MDISLQNCLESASASVMESFFVLDGKVKLKQLHHEFVLDTLTQLLIRNEFVGLMIYFDY